MAKYYIQSGTLRATLAADDSRRAALWAVHQAMRQIAPMFDDPDLSPAEKSEHVSSEGLVVLDGKIRLSEKGFDRDDAEQVDTMDVVIEWNKLMVALDRLERLFGPTN